MRVALEWSLPHDHFMTSPAAFRDQTNWSDGYYELAIEVGSSDDAQLQAVLSALWSAADVGPSPVKVGTRLLITRRA